jgi:hypothetical protein
VLLQVLRCQPDAGRRFFWHDNLCDRSAVFDQSDTTFAMRV